MAYPKLNHFFFGHDAYYAEDREVFVVLTTFSLAEARRLFKRYVKNNCDKLEYPKDLYPSFLKYLGETKDSLYFESSHRSYSFDFSGPLISNCCYDVASVFKINVVFTPKECAVLDKKHKEFKNKQRLREEEIAKEKKEIHEAQKKYDEDLRKYNEYQKMKKEYAGLPTPIVFPDIPEPKIPDILIPAKRLLEKLKKAKPLKIEDLGYKVIAENMDKK